MKIIKLLSILAIVFSFSSCTFRTYYLNSTKAIENFTINEDKKMAIYPFISTDSNVRKISTDLFIEKLDTSLIKSIIKPKSVDSIFTKNKIYALPNNIPDELIEDISKIIDSEYLLVGYIINWNETDENHEGLVEQKLSIIDLKQKKEIWNISNKVYISAPDEDTYIIDSPQSAYDKLAKRTIKELSKISNIKRKTISNTKGAW
ncbi:hypothetical protein [Aureivirga sp. CE67]|uniref:hypothetical protein n=1 Tax=Aureivirga sp. CE67 TaxID=1788983 RepID=UPI0018CB795A|nr:hypothetical protein [Aureivirga sp. CE67]